MSQEFTRPIDVMDLFYIVSSHKMRRRENTFRKFCSQEVAKISSPGSSRSIVEWFNSPDPCVVPTDLLMVRLLTIR